MKLFYQLICFIYCIFFYNHIIALNAPIVVGTDYTIIANKPVVKGKTKVMEFFSFNCIHCQTINNILTKKQLATIKLEKIQVAWAGNQAFIAFAKINATLSILKLDLWYDIFFNAIINDKIDVTNIDNIKQILIKNHLKPNLIKQFFTVFNSFEVNTKVNEYKDLTQKYNIISTPTFLINDKYLLKPAKPERTIEIINFFTKQAQY